MRRPKRANRWSGQEQFKILRGHYQPKTAIALLSRDRHGFFGHNPKEMRMSETMLAALTNIRTAEDMIVAFRDEEQCRRLLESMVWPVSFCS